MDNILYHKWTILTKNERFWMMLSFSSNDLDPFIFQGNLLPFSLKAFNIVQKTWTSILEYQFLRSCWAQNIAISNKTVMYALSNATSRYATAVIYFVFSCSGFFRSKYIFMRSQAPSTRYYIVFFTNISF